MYFRYLLRDHRRHPSALLQTMERLADSNKTRKQELMRIVRIILIITAFWASNASRLNAQIVSWETKYTGSTGTRLNAVNFPSGQASVGYVVGNSGIFLRTSDNGETWMSISTGRSEHLLSVFFTDMNTGFVVGTSGLIMRTTTGGYNWDIQSSGTTENIRSIFFTDANTGHAVGGTFNRVILRTTNGGTTWTAPSFPSGGGKLNAVHFPTASVGYAPGDGGALLKTVDGGATWAAITAPWYQYWYSAYFTDANNGYIGGNSCSMAKTTDGGASWSPLRLQASSQDTIVSIHSRSTTNVFCARSGKRCDAVWKDAAGDNNWIPRRGPANRPEYLILQGLYFTDANTGVAVGNEYIYKTTVGAAYDPIFVKTGGYSDISCWDCFKPVTGDDVYFNSGTTCTVGEQPPEFHDVTVYSTAILDMQSYVLNLTDSSKLYGTLRTTNTSAAPFTAGKDWSGSYPYFGYGTVEFYANADQTIPYGTYHTLIVSGNIPTNAPPTIVKKTFSGNATVADLRLNGALVDPGGTNTLTVGDDGYNTTVGYSADNMIIADHPCALRRVANSLGSGSYTGWNPIGEITGTREYSPIQISISTSPLNSSVCISVTDDVHPNIGSPVTYIDRYWTLSSTNLGSTMADVQCKYVDADVHEPEAWMYAGKWNGASWDPYGLTNAASNTFQAVYVSTLDGDYTGGGFGPLPVELVSFRATLDKHDVHLSWRTATEVNNDRFEIQKSYDRSNWSTIGSVEGSGTSNVPHSYSYLDRLASKDNVAPVISYRLRQIDRDGKTTYSSVLAVSVEDRAADGFQLRNFPNPFSASTNISFTLPYAQHVDLTITDISGRAVCRVLDAAMLDPGSHTVSFAAAALPAGTYVCELRTAAGSMRKVLLLSR
jgi:photosystem II stability/assembly factor-like uncharacterized protein